jgi:hypothetical protein
MKRKTKPKPEEIVTDAARYIPRCPSCGTAISAQTTVEAFEEPADWNFWGRKGERWRRCEGEQGGHRYIHFRTLLNGQFSERLAWLTPAADLSAEQMELILEAQP